MARYGYSRDKKKGKLQIIFGLLCDAAGFPIAVEVFEGNINDAKTLSPILEKVRERFGIKRVVLVGDRGVLTWAPIEEELKGREDLDADYRVKSTASPRVGRTLL
ncbi:MULTISPECIES: transposase [unclassified Microcoleus]|uniref:transposase n=1 Tax=unclassified Microcoleus TaxID=2642155 RepID=UPI0040407376